MEDKEDFIPIDDGNSNFDLVEFVNGYPQCKTHGAMSKVSPGPEGLWRCLTTSETECRAGAKQKGLLKQKTPQYFAVEYSWFWNIQSGPYYGDENILDAEVVGAEQAEINAKLIVELLNKNASP